MLIYFVFKISKVKTLIIIGIFLFSTYFFVQKYEDIIIRYYPFNFLLIFLIYNLSILVVDISGIEHDIGLIFKGTFIITKLPTIWQKTYQN